MADLSGSRQTGSRRTGSRRTGSRVSGARPHQAGSLFLDQRRQAVIHSIRRVGLDYLLPRRAGRAADGGELWDLELHFLPADASKTEAGVARVPLGVSPDNLRITLGELLDPGVRVKSVAEGAEDGCLVARVRRDPPSSGEAAAAAESRPVYTLELVDLPQVDRFFRRCRFVFQDGGGELAAAAIIPALAVPREVPEIDYLAKDYESFRQLMLERMRAFVPSWDEAHAADLGVTVVELLAHAADYLSYYQDAAATEAYIATARRRISVRRHARLVGYRLHEGCNARCWAELEIEPREAGGAGQTAEAATAGLELPAGIEVLTYCGHIAAAIERGSQEHRRALRRDPLVFRTVQPETLYPAHNRIAIYTWRTETYSLAKGATRAALCGHLEHLRSGDVLIFERLRDPGVENEEDIDPRDRQAVRLCRPPELATDLAPGADVEAEPAAITEVEWFAEDELHEEFPVSARIGGTLYRGLTMVRGNVVLLDHGETHHEVLEPVPGEGRYAPTLQRQGLTHRVPFDPEIARSEPAAGALDQDPRRALPDIELYELASEDLGEDGSGLAPEELEGSSRRRWQPRHDLLASRRFARDFVVELDADGSAHLRFGDDQHGQRPSPGTVFEAVYRVGLGPAGNLGAYALRHAVLPGEVSARCARQALHLSEAKNHLAGGGGLDREPVDKARLFAPQALHSRGRLERCVTERDYAEIAERHPDVLRAAARLKWSGSWNLAQLYIQRPAGRAVDELFERRLRRYMRPYMLAGWELEVASPVFVPLDLRLTVWPDPSVGRENLRLKLRQRVVAREVDFLLPGYFTFGKPVYLSEVIAQVMALPEVVDVEVDVFQRWGQPARGELEAGEIPIQPLEIAQIDNDLSAPHRGGLRATIGKSSS